MANHSWQDVATAAQLPTYFALSENLPNLCLCTAACVVELPVFHFMGAILKFVGVQEMLHWAMFFFLVKVWPLGLGCKKQCAACMYGKRR